MQMAGRTRAADGTKQFCCRTGQCYLVNTPFLMANFYARFLQTVEQFPDVIALEMQRESGELERYTYSDLRRMAEAVGQWLVSNGVPRGTRCAILANNGPRWV